ncbi:hypothetical protein Hanom_Chr12g01134861 [Helianthus anomalus]
MKRALTITHFLKVHYDDDDVVEMPLALTINYVLRNKPNYVYQLNQIKINIIRRNRTT